MGFYLSEVLCLLAPWVGSLQVWDVCVTLIIVVPLPVARIVVLTLTFHGSWLLETV